MNLIYTRQGKTEGKKRIFIDIEDWNDRLSFRSTLFSFFLLRDSTRSEYLVSIASREQLGAGLAGIFYSTLDGQRHAAGSANVWEKMI